MSSGRYFESTPVPWRFLLYGVGVLITVAGIGITLPADLATDPSVVLIWMVAILIGSGFGMLGRTFSQFAVTIDGDLMQFGYLDWKVTMPIADIARHSTEEVSLMTYNGYGWRVGLDGTIAYVFRAGPAVVIETPIHTYAFSCSEPDKVRAMLDAAGAGQSDAAEQAPADADTPR